MLTPLVLKPEYAGETKRCQVIGIQGIDRAG